MSCEHFKTGDRGQRYEISVFDADQAKRIVVAWVDDKDDTDGIAESFETRPGWTDAEVLDRQQETDK